MITYKEFGRKIGLPLDRKGSAAVFFCRKCVCFSCVAEKGVLY